MTRCNRNEAIARKIGYKQVDKSMEVDFTVMEDIDACAKINTRKYIETKSDSSAYVASSRPDDMINPCGGFGCKTTGTLFITTEQTASETEGNTIHTASGKFSTISDATNYVAGVVSYYVHVPAEGTYTLKTTLSDISDEAQTNADVYETTLVADKEGFYPIMVDVSKAPAEVVGEGWQASQSGTVITIEASKEDTSAEAISIGLSSISFFDEIADLQGNVSVKLGCMTGIEGDDTIDALEEQCLTAGYDETTTAVEREITFTTFTPNAMILNPLLQKADEVDGFIMQTVEKVVEEEDGYGVVTIADAYAEECGYIYASLNDDCNVTDSVLNRVNSPVLLDLNERQFQVMNSSVGNVDFVGTKVYVDSALVGKTLLISYPKQAEVEESFVATEKGVNDRRVKMTFTKTTTDGYAEIHEFNNVLITSFPMAITNENMEHTLGLSIQRDGNGYFYTVKRINLAVQ